MDKKLNYLVIKPTLNCLAKCDICSLRLKFFESKKSQNIITLDEWENIFQQAKQMGCKNLCISGGEPLMYRHLYDLIRLAVTYDFKVDLNTNGVLITRECAKSFKSAGLYSVNISLYSANPTENDKQRHLPGGFYKALDALRFCKEEGIITLLQTVITKYNIDELDRWFELACQLQVNSIWLSYLEGDVDKKSLPTEQQILNFRENVITRIYQVIKKYCSNYQDSISKVNTIFSDDKEAIRSFANGDYAKVKKMICRIPYNFAMILANGEVLPCNGVEYSHEPVVGNVKTQSLQEVFFSKQWNDYRKYRHMWCAKCPMGLHTVISLNYK